MSGTDPPYGAASAMGLPSLHDVVSKVDFHPIALRIRYAMSSTDVGYVVAHLLGLRADPGCAAISCAGQKTFTCTTRLKEAYAYPHRPELYPRTYVDLLVLRCVVVLTWAYGGTRAK
eukprot:2074088-Rhodomonas_salina.3